MRQRYSRAVAGLTAGALVAGGALGAVVMGTQAAAADDSVVLENDFEETFEPWGPRGPVTLELVDDARTGDGALSVTDRTGDWNGPSTQVGSLFSAGATYDVEAWVKLPADAPDATDLHFTVQESSAEGDDYVWVGGAVTATADEWVQVGGAYTLPAGLTAAELYLEAAPVDGEHPPFLVDDLVVTAVESGPPVDQPEPGVVLSTDFEDGLDGWGPRTGDGTAPTVEVTTADAASGAASAIVTDRDDQGDGIGRDVSGVLSGGVQYEISAQVRFAEGQETDSVWLSLASTAGGSTSYATLAQWTGVTDSGWTEVTATFQAPTADEQLLYLETSYNGTNTSDLLVDDIVLTVPDPAEIEDLAGIHTTLPFPAGVAIDSRETSGKAAELLTRHFDQITAENHMKPDAWYDDARTFRPHPQAVELMDFAAENGLDVYGHVLVWHSQTPDWFFEDADGAPLTDSAADQEILRERMRTHIFDIAEWMAADYGEFGADNPVTAWDVVNEVVSDGGTDDGLRRSEWYRILGEEFIDLSFRYADEAFNETYAAEGADRPVTLFINDYNTEQGGKQDRYLALVERLVEREVPIDGVGHQFHVSLAMPVAALEAAIVRFEHLPLVQAVTELDVTVGTPVTQANLIEQGYYFRDAFRVFREHADALFCATVWGLTDGRSWRADNGAPLVFDDAYQAKPAYHGIVDGDLPAQQRSAHVFAGSVELEGSAAASPQWDRLPLHPITASGQEVAGFQLRWAADHLTAYVSVTDASDEGSDAVTFDLDGGTAVVGRDGTVTGEGSAEVVETDAGYDVVAHLPLDGAAQGGTLGFDVQVSDGGTVAGWNTPGTLGSLTLIEELSFVEVAEASTAPVVDGDVDEVWADADVVTTERQVEGASGAVATVRTLWAEDTLYVLAEVTDPVVDVSASDPWVQDSVEIFLDTGNTKNGSYEADDTQIRISAENAVSFGTGDAAEQEARLDSAATLTDDGYVIEAAIDLLGQGGEGSFHGLDFQVNDATAGTRTSVTTWADPTGTGYQYTNRWGVGELVATEAPAAPGWVTGQVYTAGDEVSHDGALYRATWWTTETPGASPWGSWQEIATAPDGTAVWTASRIFTAGDVVVHDGDRYEAKWWTRNQAPGDRHGPWKPVS
ncbi:endo-1,4-beta-xylanase [Isoptericola halotolerans]|uniref:Beta-xylanase n=1 Tax=Isoptericola halotolerans TaxID=300560 RepID=A0ABX2A792_9MICO|nr:endo-1,4-beta-xylanase [Isoptericola halotolerans]NOV97453.1 endo-1,4-beta-xylanase [Isoptericola halotolerans]